MSLRVTLMVSLSIWLQISSHIAQFFAPALLASTQQGRKNQKADILMSSFTEIPKDEEIAFGTFALSISSNVCDETNKPKQQDFSVPQIHAVLEEQGQHVRHRIHGDVPGRGVAGPSDKQGLDAKKRVQSDTRNFSNFNGKPFIY